MTQELLLHLHRINPDLAFRVEEAVAQGAKLAPPAPVPAAPPWADPEAWQIAWRAQETGRLAPAVALIIRQAVGR